MKIDVSQPLKSLKGEPIQERKSPTEVVVLKLSHIMIEALLRPDEKASGMDKMHRFDFAQKVYKAEGIMEISAEDIVMLKVLINARFSEPLIVGQVFSILDTCV